jgi:hypothetical protein
MMAAPRRKLTTIGRQHVLTRFVAWRMVRINRYDFFVFSDLLINCCDSYAGCHWCAVFLHDRQTKRSFWMRSICRQTSRIYEKN